MVSSRETRTALYRFYDSGMGLLYVGITQDPWRRWSQHAREKPWYRQAKHWTVTWYESEPLARLAETQAIKGERPRFNIAGAPEPIPVRFTVRPATVTLLGLLWIGIPYFAVFAFIAEPSWKGWLSVVGYPFLVTAPVVLLAIMMINSPNAVRRFGAWLERHVDTGARPAHIPVPPQADIEHA